MLLYDMHVWYCVHGYGIRVFITFITESPEAEEDTLCCSAGSSDGDASSIEILDTAAETRECPDGSPVSGPGQAEEGEDEVEGSLEDSSDLLTYDGDGEEERNEGNTGGRAVYVQYDRTNVGVEFAINMIEH